MEEIGKLKRQFTMLVSGQSAGGKTQFVKQLINTPDIFEEYPSKIIISYQANPAQYKDLSDVELCYGLPNIEELCELPGIKLLVLDDATQLISNKKNELIDLFTIKSHHNSLSCILICHNPFLQDLRTIRLQSTYQVFFKNPNDLSYIHRFSSQAFPGRNKFFLSAFAKATEKPYSYLLFDASSNVKDCHRLRSHITDTPQYVYKDG